MPAILSDISIRPTRLLFIQSSLKADLAVISANKKGSLKTFQAAFCHNGSCFLRLSFQAAYISASALRAFSRWPFCGGRLCAGSSSR